MNRGPSSSYENSRIEQEQLLVEKILAPGGVRVAPPREDLNRFISRYSIHTYSTWAHVQMGWV